MTAAESAREDHASRPVLSLAAHYPLAAFIATGIFVGLFLLLLAPPFAGRVFQAVALIGGAPLVWQTLRNMLAGRFHVDTVAAIAIIASIAMGEYLAGALVALMQSGGEALEDYGLRRANRSLENLLRRAPGTARALRDGEFREIPAAEVRVGDVLLVRQGDIIAADGLVIEGEGEVDESALTGEPVPLTKLPGDRVYSGTINLSGSFRVRATNTAAQSKYELIVRMVQRAQGEKAPINRLANRYTPAFTLLTLAMAGIALLVTGEPVRALTVLVVATPCPLIIATPLAVLSAINRAAALNIIVKSGAAVEEAGIVDTVVFDKTGTLTVGNPSLSAILTLDGFSSQTDSAGNSAPADRREEDSALDLLRGAAAVEMLSPHVMAAAVVHAAREKGIAVHPAEDVRETPGAGIEGKVDGRRFCVGSAAYLARCCPNGADTIAALSSRLPAQRGRSAAFVAVDGVPEGALVFEDRLRPESEHLVSRLNQLGIRRTVMLTGDAPEPAAVTAETVGITEVRARLHPEDKLTAVRELARDGTVMMVGDGINDAPALAAADVGVAMGGYGAGIATDAADMVITVENVERVADAIEIGRRMTRIAKQGILLGIGFSVALMFAALFGLFPPAVGALLQEAIDLAAILNALRAR